MNNQLKACIAGAFILLITLLLLSKCTRCRDERQPEPIAQAPVEQPVVEEPVEEPPVEDPNDAANIGGTGDLKIVLTWEFPGDIDIHVTQPNGNTINFRNKNDYRTGGNLDVDNLEGGRPGAPAAENVYWSNPPAGRYHVMVKFYSDRLGGENGGTVMVTVFNNGERTEYPVTLNRVGQEVDVVDIDYQPRANS